ncbi:MAG: hypothetical protein ACRC37_00610, partial [Lentisphaeria bacterium]
LLTILILFFAKTSILHAIQSPITISGADIIGYENGRYYLASSLGNTIRFSIPPNNPPLKWLGISATNHSAEELLQKIGKREIIVNFAENNITYELHVFASRPKQPPKIDFNIIRNDSVCKNNFGLLLRNNQLETQGMNIYYENGSAKLSCNSIKNNLVWGINNWGRKAWPQEAGYINNSIKIKARNDLTPNYNGIPPRQFFWVPAITIKHEKFHITDWSNIYRRQLITSIEAISLPINVSLLKSPSQINFELLKQLAQIKIDSYIRAEKLYKGTGLNHEERAYLDGRDDYLSIVDDIK